jgi:phosphoglycolate phosphatase
MRRKMTKLILFDLDGTLVETGPGILNSLKKTFKEIGKDLPDDETLERFIGPTLDYSFQTYANISEEEVPLMVQTFRKYYKSEGIFMGGPYPGMIRTLEWLSERCQLAVATAKPQSSAETVLCHFGLKDYFKTVVGSDFLIKRIEKNDIITKVLESHLDIPKDKIWMVGDRIYDIQGAKSLGINSIGATYGYGLDEEFREATHLIDSPEQLIALWESENRKGTGTNG